MLQVHTRKGFDYILTFFMNFDLDIDNVSIEVLLGIINQIIHYTDMCKIHTILSDVDMIKDLSKL